MHGLLRSAQPAEVHQLIGDAIMGVFDTQGDQPAHVLLAARAALAVQEEATAVSEEHPELQVKGKAEPVTAYVLLDLP